jgi:hypothetical protein
MRDVGKALGLTDLIEMLSSRVREWRRRGSPQNSYSLLENRRATSM